MKTHTCDICQKEINSDNPPAPQSAIQVNATIGGKDFVAEFRAVTWPGIDVCFGCFAAAMGASKLPTPIKPAPTK